MFPEVRREGWKKKRKRRNKTTKIRKDLLGKEVVRIAHSKNKNRRWTLTQNHYQTGSQPGMNTLRRGGKSWQKRTRKWKKIGASKRRKLKKDRLKRRMTRILRTMTL